MSQEYRKLLELEPKRREAIINAGIKEFTTKGYDNASTNIIAKEAGMSKALMFHYIHTKKEFFIFLFNYCVNFIKDDLLDKIDYSERDLFNRLRQTAILKGKAMQKHPLIFDFIIKATVMEEENNVKKELEKHIEKFQQPLIHRLFNENIDNSKFREELDIEKCKKLIYWAIEGYRNEIINFKLLKDGEISLGNNTLKEFDLYLEELKKSFYKKSNEDAQ